MIARVDYDLLPTNMKRVVIAYDGSAGAGFAIADLPKAGLPEQLEARVLTIADVWLPPESADGNSQHVKANELLRQARELAAAGALEVRKLFPGWSVSEHAQAESPAWGILGESRKWNANLIVIGSHGRSPLERFLLGSVSYKVAAEATCSVRVVKPHPRPSGRPLRILVGVDGSDDSRNAVHEVLARRWPSETEFHLATVVDSRLESFLASNSPDAIFSSITTKFEKQSLPFQLHRLEGDPKDKLLRISEEKNVDAIFLGARGLHHGERLYLGTTASAVCTRAPCTVEIIRNT